MVSGPLELEESNAECKLEPLPGNQGLGLSWLAASPLRASVDLNFLGHSQSYLTCIYGCEDDQMFFVGALRTEPALLLGSCPAQLAAAFRHRLPHHRDAILNLTGLLLESIVYWQVGK